jgi:hypothetical protein
LPGRANRDTKRREVPNASIILGTEPRKANGYPASYGLSGRPSFEPALRAHPKDGPFALGLEMRDLSSVEMHFGFALVRRDHESVQPAPTLLDADALRKVLHGGEV